MESATDAVDDCDDYRESKRKSYTAWRHAYVSRVLEMFNWNVTQAARHAGMDRANFNRILRECGLVRPTQKKETV